MLNYASDHPFSACARLFGKSNIHSRDRLNSFMHNVVKWPNIPLKSCGVHTTRFLKYVCSFNNIMHERVKQTLR